MEHGNVRIRPVTPRVIESRQEDSPDEYDIQKLLSKLANISVSSFQSIKRLELCINTDEVPLHKISEECPQLTELKLNGSSLESLRDLGTGWNELTILWVVRTGLVEFEGISAFPKLSELYAAFNAVTDLSCLMFNDTLQVLDIEGNQIGEWSQIEQLKYCDQLWSLNLESNPIVKNLEYRSKCLEMLPQLQILDDNPREATVSAQTETNFNIDSKEPDELELVTNSVRESTPKRKQAEIRPKSANPMFRDEGVSHLTEEIFSGNPLKAMRYRRNRLFQDRANFDIMTLIKEFKVENTKDFKPVHVPQMVRRTRKVMARERFTADYETKKNEM
ncbi:unnamed protein product [Blepharisma stoltei]|uniref:Leucine-rich repeat-containing protein 56 n=1 Tax=Blepharisma stoltei TaxID=1481888 RepID=A0AAU9IXE4_9CILI|nr:unnamed protein product [Blepharisma stoltei]